MTLYFLIPVFNESQNLDLLYSNLSELKLNYERFYLFVDDCSTDDSVNKICDLFRAEKYKIITKQRNIGPGHSFNIGFEWILQTSNSPDDLVITIESDNTSDLKILPDMISIANLGYNMILASVYAQGGGFYKTSFFRKLISFGGNSIFRAFFSIKVNTLSSFYRVYQLSLLKEIRTKYDILITQNGFICMVEILLKALVVNAKVIEVPMIMQSQNRSGKSKMKIVRTILSYLGFLFKYKGLLKSSQES